MRPVHVYTCTCASSCVWHVHCACLQVLKQLDANQQLLEKLLEEQKGKLSASSNDLKTKLAAETKERSQAASELSRLREAVAASEKKHEAEVMAC